MDLSSSVNLIPYSIYVELGLSELKPFSSIVQLDDRSFRTPRGQIDDVFVQIDKAFFPVDFVVLEIDPSLLRRSLLFYDVHSSLQLIPSSTVR